MRASRAENAFEKVAAEVSDSPSKANGGLLGPLSVNDLSPDFRKLIEGLKAGEITQVVRTQRGYQVLKLESSTHGRRPCRSNRRASRSASGCSPTSAATSFRSISKLRSQAIIEWKNDDVKKAYQEGLTEQAKEAATAPPAT